MKLSLEIVNLKTLNTIFPFVRGSLKWYKGSFYCTPPRGLLPEHRFTWTLKIWYGHISAVYSDGNKLVHIPLLSKDYFQNMSA